MARSLNEMMAFNRQLVEQMRIMNQGRHGGEAVERNARGWTPAEARREYLEFARNRPTFERGRGRWVDFAQRFDGARQDHGVGDQQAKWVLYNAIEGQSSRLVIASMNPTRGDYVQMSFSDYLSKMGDKFTPAAESVQMEAEYKTRKQGKQEDVQNYVNAKYELFQLAYPNAQARDVEEFYREATEGFLNKYVRDQMFSFQPTNVETFGARAVHLVQIERRRIRIGDSDTGSMDGLIPVTRPMQEVGGRRRGEPMEVDALYAAGQETEDDEDGDCECMALQEKGFRGPCYYCYRQGHILRNCPRKSAGLPKVANPGDRDGGGAVRPRTYARPLPNKRENGNGAANGRRPLENGNGNTHGRRPPRQEGGFSKRRVQQLEDPNPEEADEGEDYYDDQDTGSSGDAAAHFLGDWAL